MLVTEDGGWLDDVNSVCQWTGGDVTSN